MLWIGHKHQLILIPVWLKQFHQTVVVNDIVKVRINSTVVIEMLQSIVVRLFNIENFSGEISGNVRIFEEHDWVIELGQ